MRKLLTLLLPLAILAAGSCTHDEISVTDDIIGGGTYTDPELNWSAASCTAYMAGDNVFPTLSNPYGVSVSYSSSQTAVATIGADGTITLAATGETVITAFFEGDDSYDEDSVSYTLTVVLSEGNLSWSAESSSVVIGEESHSYPALSNPNNLSVTYSSSEESVAAIDPEGEITLLSGGETIITAAFAGNGTYEQCSASYTLTVTKNTDAISWSAAACTVTIGASGNTFPILNNPGEQAVTYSSSNIGVATVNSDGTLTLVSAGETTITAKSEARSTDTVDYAAATVSYGLTVQEEGVNLVSADLSWPASTYSVTMTESFVSPTLNNPHGLTVVYSSSDPDVATISENGTVTIQSAGTTTITASSEKTDTYLAGSAYYTLTVSRADAGLSWSSSTATATFGEENTFPALINPNGLDVAFTSSDEGVATVDGNGNVTPVASGTTYIKACFAGNGTYAEATATYTLKVNKGTPSISWSASSYSADIEASSWDFPVFVTNPAGLEVTCSSSDVSVATVDASTGIPTPVSTGSTTITAVTTENDCYKSATAYYTLTVISSADTGAGTYTYATAGDASSDDDISNTTFSRMITVTYSATGATVTGYTSDFVVTVRSNQVTITNSGTENVVYYLTGTASDGFFKLYSAKKQALHLYNLTLTNPNGAAINNQSGKRTFVYVEGTNTLSDGSSAAYSSGDEDMKAVFFSEGQLCFSGDGTLKVTANNSQEKSGIASDDYVRFMKSPAVTVTSGSNAGHGIRANDYVQISDGTLTISASAATKKGISSDDYVLVEGGVSTITVSGGTAYDSDDAEYKGSAGIKADNYFGMTGGTLTINNTGKGGKGISAGSYDYDATGHTLSDSYISGGTLTITCTGSESNDVSAKGIKVGWATKSGSGEHATVTGYAGNLVISGGTVNVSASGGEGIEAKGTLTVTDGYVYGYSSYDDGINCLNDMTISGGYVCAWTTGSQTGADGFDANGNLYIKGGVVYGVCTHGSPDVAFDANTEGGKKLYVQGGTLIAVGGLESGASITGSAYKASSLKKSTWYGLWNSSSNAMIAFKTPSAGNSLVVYSGGSSVTLKSGITYSGTSVFGGNAYVPGTLSGGTSVSLSTYSSGSGGPGGRPGGF